MTVWEQKHQCIKDSLWMLFEVLFCHIKFCYIFWCCNICYNYPLSTGMKLSCTQVMKTASRTDIHFFPSCVVWGNALLRAKPITRQFHSLRLLALSPHQLFLFISKSSSIFDLNLWTILWARTLQVKEYNFRIAKTVSKWERKHEK